jgi:hypothetical protein
MDNVQLALNLLAAPFGLPAMYYGYRGYLATRGGLKAYKYFFIAMVSVGAVLFFDLFRLLRVPGFAEFEILIEVAFLVAALFFMLAFRDMVRFLSSMF